MKSKKYNFSFINGGVEFRLMLEQSDIKMLIKQLENDIHPLKISNSSYNIKLPSDGEVSYVIRINDGQHSLEINKI